ncbi:hypothetical protein NMG60_11023001 [Bertholletia excelsa]
MKKTSVAAAVLVSLLTLRRIFLLLSSSSSDFQLLDHSMFVSGKPTKLASFLALNVILLAIFLGNTPKLSPQDFDSFNSYLPPLVCEVEEAEDEGFNDENEDFLPRLVYVECKQEKTLLLDYFHKEDEEDGDDRDGNFHGYDGYEEENDIDDGDDDASTDYEGYEDEDLRRRIEEFIAKNMKQWQEESLNDNKLLLLAPAE